MPSSCRDNREDWKSSGKITDVMQNNRCHAIKKKKKLKNAYLHILIHNACPNF